MSKKKTKTVKVTCRECGRVVRVSKGSQCHREQLCYACITDLVTESNDGTSAGVIIDGHPYRKGNDE